MHFCGKGTVMKLLRAVFEISQLLKHLRRAACIGERLLSTMVN